MNYFSFKFGRLWFVLVSIYVIGIDKGGSIFDVFFKIMVMVFI